MWSRVHRYDSGGVDYFVIEYGLESESLRRDRLEAPDAGTFLRYKDMLETDGAEYNPDTKELRVRPAK